MTPSPEVRYQDPRTEPDLPLPHDSSRHPSRWFTLVEENRSAVEAWAALAGQVIDASIRLHTIDSFRIFSAVWSNRTVFDADFLPESILSVGFEKVLEDFAVGVGDVRPSFEVQEVARTLVRAAEKRLREPEISVDVDGALSFDLRLANGRLVMAELTADGRLHVGTFDENDSLETHRTTKEYQYLLSLIEQ